VIPRLIPSHLRTMSDFMEPSLCEWRAELFQAAPVIHELSIRHAGRRFCQDGIASNQDDVRATESLSPRVGKAGSALGFQADGGTCDAQPGAGVDSAPAAKAAPPQQIGQEVAMS